ncbi:MAG: hypothetical protein KDA87_23945, partial [Planctomycetales bacterium]|nr:hypothetical protein [Planctomycetales bacterium]
NQYWKSRFDTPLKIVVAMGFVAWLGGVCLYLVRLAELRRLGSIVGVPVLSVRDEIQLVALPVEHLENEVRMRWRLCANRRQRNLAGTSGAVYFGREIDELLLFSALTRC